MRRGFLVLEIIISSALIAVALIGYGVITHNLVRAHDQSIVEHRVRGAAELAINCVRAGVTDAGDILAALDPDLADMLDLTIEEAPAEGEWAGARRVTVTASTLSSSAHQARVTLTAMISAAGDRP
ncbi:MAG: hypothetical protein KDA32_11690 [Phycisphaerales bacterium]|nr:hypothetical protein [Phycisphaerales bacterium]